MRLYRVLRAACWVFSHFTARLTVLGKANVPRTGPFFLIANHQSALDPIYLQALIPKRRDIYTFTKSTQFAKSFFGWVLPRVQSIPVRRYRVDAQAVRVALRLLQSGKVVGIYPEGERTWDGELLPFRRGTIRLLLKAGVPVLPCAVIGSYDVWPRWSTLRRGRVTIRFGEPIDFGAHDSREQRDRALPEAERRIRRALEGMLREGVRPS